MRLQLWLATLEFVNECGKLVLQICKVGFAMFLHAFWRIVDDCELVSFNSILQRFDRSCELRFGHVLG